MHVYKYWAKVCEKIDIDGKSKEITCFGGSNFSLNAAQDEAHKKIGVVQRKIKGEDITAEEYNIEIREELVDRIDDKNAITRNRYGALVLNSENTIVIDVDEPKYSFLDFFRNFNIEAKKQKMLNQIIKSTAHSSYSEMGFRIYETRKGYRVIVTNLKLSSKDQMVKKLFKRFNCDPIYARLCFKQECFRARLTPKPSNMKHPAYKVIFPRNTIEQDQFAEWLSSYNKKSEKYSTCKLVHQVGQKGSGCYAIETHDKLSKIEYSQNLA